MKKFISVVISIIVAVSAMTMATVPALAAVSPQSTTHARVVSVEVNGSSTTDVSYSTDSTDPNKVSFTYTGKYDLEGWEFPGLVEGVDYDIVSQDGNTVTIVIYNENADVVANAIVSKNEEDTTKPGKTDDGPTSPDTGAMTAAGIAVAGAGVAILTALKKDKDAE